MPDRLSTRSEDSAIIIIIIIIIIIMYIYHALINAQMIHINLNISYQNNLQKVL